MNKDEFNQLLKNCNLDDWRQAQLKFAFKLDLSKKQIEIISNESFDFSTADEIINCFMDGMDEETVLKILSEAPTSLKEQRINFILQHNSLDYSENNIQLMRIIIEQNRKMLEKVIDIMSSGIITFEKKINFLNVEELICEIQNSINTNLAEIKSMLHKKDISSVPDTNEATKAPSLFKKLFKKKEYSIIDIVASSSLSEEQIAALITAHNLGVPNDELINMADNNFSAKKIELLTSISNSLGNGTTDISLPQSKNDSSEQPNSVIDDMTDTFIPEDAFDDDSVYEEDNDILEETFSPEE